MGLKPNYTLTNADAPLSELDQFERLPNDHSYLVGETFTYA
jgi:hypothetical protein